VALALAFLAGYHGHTRAAYRRDLEGWWCWCAAHDLAVLEVARVHVELYARELEAAGRARSTVARRLAALAGFYRDAVDEGALARSPVAHVRRPRVDDDSPTLGLDRGELVALLPEAERAGPRDHALACLLALNGLRVSEACATDAGDLGAERGHWVLAVVRKGGRRALVPLAPRTVAAIQAHLAGRSDGPLLLANDGGRLNRHQAARVVRRLARRAGITKRVGPHALRRGFVTAALDAGVPLRDVQDAAGHRDPRTTRCYDSGRQSLDRHATYAVAAYLAGDGTASAAVEDHGRRRA